MAWFAHRRCLEGGDGFAEDHAPVVEEVAEGRLVERAWRGGEGFTEDQAPIVEEVVEGADLPRRRSGSCDAEAPSGPGSAAQPRLQRARKRTRGSNQGEEGSSRAHGVCACATAIAAAVAAFRTVSAPNRTAAAAALAGGWAARAAAARLPQGGIHVFAQWVYGLVLEHCPLAAFECRARSSACSPHGILPWDMVFRATLPPSLSLSLSPSLSLSLSL